MTKAELCESISNLGKDQYHIYKKYVKWIKKLVKSKLNNTKPPKPPRVFMHGSGGKFEINNHYSLKSL